MVGGSFAPGHSQTLINVNWNIPPLQFEAKDDRDIFWIFGISGENLGFLRKMGNIMKKLGCVYSTEHASEARNGYKQYYS